MWLDILFLAIGLLLVLGGANALTDGGSALAKRFRVSDLTIGLTVVAFGTSAPELVTSLLSAWEGNTGLAVGNVVGSNIFNVLMILGCTAIVSPVPVTRGMLSREIPLVLLASLVLSVLASDRLLDGAAQNMVGRTDALVLIAFFLVFLRYTFATAASPEMPADGGPAVRNLPLWKSLLFILGGLAGLILGGRLFVDGASEIARAAGVSDAVVGLTLVSAGTSLPELATSVVAALKKNTAMAVGNVIGSNIFNIFFVLGASAALKPLPLGGIGPVDLAVCTGASLLFWITARFFRERTITRLEGALMVGGYAAYTLWLLIGK